MKLGLENFLENHVQEYKGKRIGLVTNMTGVNHDLTPTVDLFHQHPDINLTALFGPEHGLRGDAKEGAKVGDETDPKTGLPVYSLYSETRIPSKEMLNTVDVVFFDLQDIGARYYTFIYTMANVMEACGKYGKEFVVLDRPNPINGVDVEGNLVEEGFTSFVGQYPIPNRHGLTIGELALLFKHEFHIDCDLKVIEMSGWSRGQYFDETDLFWVQPTPNTTTMDMMLLYPGTCLIEGTTLSEGRGTTKPFEFIGAPFIDGSKLSDRINEIGLSSIIARPVSFVPTYQKHMNVRCEGIQLHISNRKELLPYRTGLKVIEAIAELYPKEFQFREMNEEGLDFFNVLTGTDRLKEIILNGKVDTYLEECEIISSTFKNQSKKYHLYS
ncbi:exo-beta-N-acetylmuramidase NamZ family protein [Falsibacillus pallidus]|uniref:exo-beta-N-acetylmuramidase NamZ family protein n=1 Tax=Falsibacillus pallidus TaxID=493781 RepID=UPI003D97734E